MEGSTGDERAENRARMRQRIKCTLGVFLLDQKTVIRESSAWKQDGVEPRNYMATHS